MMYSRVPNPTAPIQVAEWAVTDGIQQQQANEGAGHPGGEAAAGVRLFGVHAGAGWEELGSRITSVSDATPRASSTD